jgi:hypothetical protein
VALCLFRRLLHTLTPVVFFIALISLSTSTGKAAIATDVGGPIFANETWTKANSPYIATDSVLIMNNTILTIEPGVEVRFETGKALTVQKGTLVARGKQPISH